MLCKQGYVAKAITVNYPDKKPELQRLKTICHRVDEPGSAVKHRAGSVRLICHMSSSIRQPSAFSSHPC